MTTTTTTFPRRLDPLADAPTDCPAWCTGHGTDYAEDFGELANLDAFLKARAAFRAHQGDMTETHLQDDGSYWELNIYQPEGLPAWIEFTADNFHRAFAHVTPHEARALAEQLVAAADRIEVQR